MIWPQVILLSCQRNMMCLNFFIIFCLVVFNRVNSAVIHIDQVEVSGHEGECYDKTGKIFYKKGEIIPNEGDECAERKCLGVVQETGKLRIEILTCPAVEAGAGCTIIQDRSKPYPDCCPHLVSMPSVEPKYCESQQQREK